MARGGKAPDPSRLPGTRPGAHRTDRRAPEAADRDEMRPCGAAADDFARRGLPSSRGHPPRRAATARRFRSVSSGMAITTQIPGPAEKSASPRKIQDALGGEFGDISQQRKGAAFSRTRAVIFRLWTRDQILSTILISVHRDHALARRARGTAARKCSKEQAMRSQPGRSAESRGCRRRVPEGAASSLVTQGPLRRPIRRFR